MRLRDCEKMLHLSLHIPEKLLIMLTAAVVPPRLQNWALNHWTITNIRNQSKPGVLSAGMVTEVPTRTITLTNTTVVKCNISRVTSSFSSPTHWYNPSDP